MIRMLIFLILYMSCTGVAGQGYDTIRVGYSTSVNMIFDSPIVKWDMGLGVHMEDGQEVWDVLVSHSPSSPGRIKLAAGVEDFETTNLFIETEDAYYNFILTYDPQPVHLLLKIGREKASIRKEEAIAKDTTVGEITAEPTTDSLIYLCSKIYENATDITDIGQVSQKMLFYLGGIYVSGNHLFFKVCIKNEGTIKYDLGFAGFFAADRGRSGNKRRPRQDELLTPVYIFNDQQKVVEQGEVVTKVYVFRKFTLDPRKHLYLQFWEGNGGERKAELVVKGKELLGAEGI